jgi:hypothetical protein
MKGEQITSSSPLSVFRVFRDEGQSIEKFITLSLPSWFEMVEGAALTHGVVPRAIAGIDAGSPLPLWKSTKATGWLSI